MGLRLGKGLGMGLGLRLGLGLGLGLGLSPVRRMACQFSGAEPCHAKALPCLALRASKAACRSGGAESITNWWRVGRQASRSAGGTWLG